MPTTRTELWKNATFTIERIEGRAPRTLIYEIAGVFNARDMYGSMRQVALGDVFEFQPAAGEEMPTLHILDLAAVPQMDSSALGTILSHVLSCRSKGIRVIVTSPSAHVLQLFRLTRVDSLIPTAASIEEALASG